MSRLKGWYRLLNHEFSRWLRFIALLCAAAVIVPLILLHSAAGDEGQLRVHPRYEDLYAASGCPILFLLLLTLLCAYFLITIYRGYWGGKSIYTYLTLPVRREALYLSKLAVFAACLLLFLAAQLISVRLGYAIFEHQLRSIYNGDQLVMHNGLFLAYVRSEFFRLLLPFSFSRILSTFSIFAVIATGFYYGALCERCRRFEGFAAIALAAFILYRAVAYRLNEVSHYTPRELYPSSLFMLALCGFFVWHSLWLIRKGAVA